MTAGYAVRFPASFRALERRKASRLAPWPLADDPNERTMELPHLQLLAPVPLAVDPERLDAGSRIVAVRGEEHLLDAVATLPELETLWVSGVGAKAAAKIGSLAHLQRLVVHDLRTADLTDWTGLTRLESLLVSGSSKLRSLDGLENLRALSELILFNCSNYRSIEPLRYLKSLRTLCLEGGFSKQLRIASLAPLSELSLLVQLRLASIRVEDGLLQPLHRLENLRSVFIAKNFKSHELRLLARALPAARGEWLDSYRS
jgi:Leucine-rich repeat (LRR) protein